MVEYNGSEKVIIMWAKFCENLEVWNAIPHTQPQRNTNKNQQTIKHSLSEVLSSLFLMFLGKIVRDIFRKVYAFLLFFPAEKQQSGMKSILGICHGWISKIVVCSRSILS